MSLMVLTRKAKMELMAVEGDICSLLFPQKKAQHACRLFLEHLKRRGGLTRSELSMFAWDLQAGKIEGGFRYSRTRFYTNIRKTLLTLGLIAIDNGLSACQNMIWFLSELGIGTLPKSMFQ